MKQCSKCKKLKKIECFGRDKKTKDGFNYWCRECVNQYSKEWHRKEYLKNPKRFREKTRLWNLKNPKRKKEISKNWRLKLRTEVLKHYGGGIPKCVCCGEKETMFLSIDHINNDGKEDRRKHGSGNTFYYWLRKNNYPKGYQVLCHNCNLAKGFYGYSPKCSNKKL